MAVPARAVPPVEDLGRLLRALALPTFGLALAISVLTTYTPVLLRELTGSRTAIGLALGAEGAFALFLPLLVGALSDRTRPTRIGRRLPYVIAASPLVALALALIPFLDSFGLAVLVIFLFFVGYFAYYPPYQALYAELVPSSHHGRAQGAQGAMRGLGLGAALVVGGLLLPVWTPLPYLAAAAVLLAVTGMLVRDVREPSASPVCCVPYGLRGTETTIRRLLRGQPGLRAFVVANALWELSFVGLKTFIVLYVVEGLGRSVGVASAAIGVVAAAYVVAALGVGRLADRIGLLRLMRGALWVYGLGLLAGAAITSPGPALVVLPVAALAGAAIMTLPYGVMMRMIAPGAEGAITGLYGFSRGLGAVTGPIVVGAAIDLGRPLFESTEGYGAMWLVIGGPILLSLVFLPPIGRALGAQGEQPASAGVSPFTAPAESAAQTDPAEPDAGVQGDRDPTRAPERQMGHDEDGDHKESA